MTRPLPLASAAILIATVLLAIGRDYPLAGHDYRYFIPRLIDTALFIKQNGWSIQWYTPSFGGGLPAFPNPQHLQFSLPQLLTGWIGAWTALLVTTAIVMLAGFAATYQLLRRRLELPHFESTLGAVFFIGSGFFIERMIVGHIGFQLFPLLPVVIDLLLDRQRRTFANAAVLALLLAATVYHAGFQLAILMAMASMMTLSLLEAGGWLAVDFRRLAKTVAAATIAALIMAAPKLFAVGSLMAQFPREVWDAYNVSLPEAIAGFGAQLFSVMLLTPLFWIARADMSMIYGGLPKFTGISPRMGLWELDSGLSPVAAVCLLLGLVHLARRGPAWRSLPARRRLAFVVLFILAWVTVDLSMTRGVWTSSLRHVPIFRSLHAGVRYAAVFILPLSIGAAKSFEAWSLAQRPVARWTMWILAVASPVAYLMLPPAAYIRNFDLSPSMAFEHRVQDGKAISVSTIADVPDADALVDGASSLRPYEPLFGYSNESFAAETTVGSVHEVRDGHFNMTNPASLAFAGAAGLRPFERIDERDRANLDAFVQRRRPDWPLPSIVPWLNRAALLAALACIAITGMTMRSRQ